MPSAYKKKKRVAPYEEIVYVTRYSDAGNLILFIHASSNLYPFLFAACPLLERKAPAQDAVHEDDDPRFLHNFVVCTQDLPCIFFFSYCSIFPESFYSLLILYVKFILEERGGFKKID